MLGLGFAVNRATRSVARALGADEKTARRAGRIAGWTTTALTFDPSGALDFFDPPDTSTDSPGYDYGYDDPPRRRYSQ
jgi:hypothetical protein